MPNIKITPVAKSIPFDNSSNGFSATDIQSAIEEIDGGLDYIKSGRKLLSDFTGSPKKATVTFGAAFPNVNYSVTITGVDGRFWTVENKTTNGFVINSNANQALTGDVFWIARIYGG